MLTISAIMGEFLQKTIPIESDILLETMMVHF
jgi:hypothetical protein